MVTKSSKLTPAQRLERHRNRKADKEMRAWGRRWKQKMRKRIKK